MRINIKVISEAFQLLSISLDSCQNPSLVVLSLSCLFNTNHDNITKRGQPKIPKAHARFQDSNRSVLNSVLFLQMCRIPTTLGINSRMQ